MTALRLSVWCDVHTLMRSSDEWLAARAELKEKEDALAKIMSNKNSDNTQQQTVTHRLTSDVSVSD